MSKLAFNILIVLSDSDLAINVIYGAPGLRELDIAIKDINIA